MYEQNSGKAGCASNRGQPLQAQEAVLRWKSVQLGLRCHPPAETYQIFLLHLEPISVAAQVKTALSLLLRLVVIVSSGRLMLWVTRLQQGVQLKLHGIVNACLLRLQTGCSCFAATGRMVDKHMHGEAAFVTAYPAVCT